jgi:uncharacterized protein YqgC (DUF456 family)
MIPLWLESILLGLITFIMLVGLFGLVVPIFPGNVVIWVAAMVYGLIVGVDKWGITVLVLLTVFMIVAALADNILMGAKAREKGAAWGSIGAALVAGVVGTFIFPPIGGLIAAPLVLFLMEFHRLGDSEKATQVVRALLIGWGLAFVVRFGIGVLMVGLWGIWAYFG